jgi:xylulokinase
MLPAVVLLDSEDRLLRPSIQQSDGRSGAQVQQMRSEMDSQHLQRAETVSTSNWWEPKSAGLNTTNRKCLNVLPRCSVPMILLTGSSGEKIIEQNWALEAGFVDISRNTLDDELIAFAHVPAMRYPVWPVPMTLSAR